MPSATKIALFPLRVFIHAIRETWTRVTWKTALQVSILFILGCLIHLYFYDIDAVKDEIEIFFSFGLMPACAYFFILLYWNVLLAPIRMQSMEPNLPQMFLFGLGSLIIFAGLSIIAFAYWQPAFLNVKSSASTQPQISLTPQKERHEILWNPSNDLMILYSKEGNIIENRASSPKFFIKTTNNTSIQDASIEWNADISSLDQLLQSSERLSNYEFSYSKEKFSIDYKDKNKPGFDYTNYRSPITISVPFITPNEKEIYIPTGVFNFLAFYTIALMPEEPGAAIHPFRFTAVIGWNLPEPGEQKFTIKASIINAKPPKISEPEVNALITFEIAGAV